LAVHLLVGKWKQALSAGLNGAIGYPFTTDFSMAHVFYGTKWLQGTHQLYILAGYNQRAFVRMAFMPMKILRINSKKRKLFSGR